MDCVSASELQVVPLQGGELSDGLAAPVAGAARGRTLGGGSVFDICPVH